MFEDIAEQGPAGFLTAVTEQLAKLPSQQDGRARFHSAHCEALRELSSP